MYPAGKRYMSREEQGLSGGGGWCGYTGEERGLERGQESIKGGTGVQSGKRGLSTGRDIWRGGELKVGRDSEGVGRSEKRGVRSAQRRGGSDRGGFSRGFRGKGASVQRELREGLRGPRVSKRGEQEISKEGRGLDRVWSLRGGESS